MDIHNPNDNSWDLDMALEINPSLHEHHHFSYDASSQNYHPLQPPTKTASSTYLPADSCFSNTNNHVDTLRGHQEEAAGEEEEELSAMKEMMYKIAAMQPVDIDPSTIRKPKRRNVRISDDPQSVAARHRRERISERIRILQRLVPGGTKMDTASMLDEAIRYVKYLKKLVHKLQSDQNPPSIVSNWPMRPDNIFFSTEASPVEPTAGIQYPFQGGDHVNINRDVSCEEEAAHN